MARFEMLGGRFTDENGETRVFRKGKRTIVTSDKPLDEMFKNSFRRLDDPTKVSKDHRDTPDWSGGQVMDDLLSKKKVKTHDREEITDLSRKKANRPQAVGKAQQEEQKRGVLREEAQAEDERDEDEVEEDTEEDVIEDETAEEDEPEAVEEEEDPAPPPPKKAKAMKKKKSK